MSDLRRFCPLFTILPTLVFTTVVPLVVRLHVHTADTLRFFWRAASPAGAEFYCHGKAVLAVGCALCALGVLFYRAAAKTLHLERSALHYPMAVYALWVALSFLGSRYKQAAWFGWFDRFEGTAVLLSYQCMLFYTMTVIKTEEQVQWVLGAVGLSSYVMSVLGLTQYAGRNFFHTALGEKLVTGNFLLPGGERIWDAIDRSHAAGTTLFSYYFTDTVTQTIGGNNYVAFYLTLLVPLFGMLFLHEGTLAKKAAWGALFALALVNMAGSRSSGGYLGIAVSAAAAVVTVGKGLLSRWKSAAVLLAITALASVLTADRLLPELSAALKTVAPAAASGAADTFDSLVTTETGVTGRYRGAAFAVIPGAVTPAALPGGLRLVDASADSFALVTADNRRWDFLRTDSGFAYRNSLGNAVVLRDVPHTGFAKNPGFGTYRGYIWSRTFPLLGDTAVLGHGADTFVLYFPHDDYVGKARDFYDFDTLIDKPHSFYLGAFVNTGGVSLAALLALFAIYAAGAFRVYRKARLDSFTAAAGAGIFFGAAGFLAAALVNDSTVTVMPMFYGLLGTAEALKKIHLRKEAACARP